MHPIEQYILDRDTQTKFNMVDEQLKRRTDRYFEYLVATNYSKSFTWMGIPIIQLPSDLMVMQEIIWKVKPDYIIECGVAFGGMTVFYKTVSNAVIYGIDVEIRKHTLETIKEFSYVHTTDWYSQKRIRLIEGSSIDQNIINEINHIRGRRVLVSLDSNHSHDHVLQELRLYAPLVSVGSYIVVLDTAIEYFPPIEKNRPWGPGDNPATAVKEFMQGNEEFIVDREVEARAGLTAAPGGWLRRIKEAKR